MPKQSASRKSIKPSTRTPPKHWMNGKTAARSAGVSVQAFTAWGVEQVGAIGRERFYTVEAIVANRLARAEERRPVPPTQQDLDADTERVLLTREQRIGQELKNAQTRRELAPVDLIDWTLGRVGSQIAAILDSIPLKVKRLVPRMTATELDHIKRELSKAQNAAARVTVDLDEFYLQRPKLAANDAEASA